tara:strand:- start:1390 stop:2709 length:1320 start_codon:yes stop_codon:yes gene_type:complete
MSLAGPSNYQVLRMEKSDESNPQTIGVEGRTIAFDYFESIYSPMITGSTSIVDTGDSVIDKKGNLATIKDGFPLEHDGTETLKFKIANENGTLTSLEPLVVTASPLTLDQSTRQVLTLELKSKFSIENSNNPKLGSYGIGTIDETVKKILKENKLPFRNENIEKSSTVDKIEGKNETPIDLIFNLSRKSKPVKGAPGFFFYETQEGFNFRSIEGLIEQGIKEYKENESVRDVRTYKYFNNQKQDLGSNEDDYNVVKMPILKRDHNLFNALKAGIYNVRIQTKNLLTGAFTDNVVNLLDKNSNYLGSKPNKSIDQNENKLEKYCKTYSYVLAPGSVDEGVSDKITNNPAEYEPQAMMRYSMLHSQVLEIQVPCNILLMAGKVIKLEIENVTGGNKVLQRENQHRSGFYLILHLRHHFDPKHSYTSLTLARDTYGLYTSSK